MKIPYLPNTENDRSGMLDLIGLSSVSDIFSCIPDAVHLTRDLEIPDPLSEPELASHALEIAGLNGDLSSYACFLGAGVYDHYIPATVSAITGRSEFYTSYTPYQPEMSQGNLQSIFEFQTMVCRLTGMDVANASMYDGASALSEAALMASSITGRTRWIVSRTVHPSYRQTMLTFAQAAGYAVDETPMSEIVTDLRALESRVGDDVACVIVQQPNFLGTVEDLARMRHIAASKGALFIVSVDPVCLGILKPPGEYDADICVGEGQPLGIAPGFGGPLLGLMACKKQYVRQMPGRLVGATVDANGARSYTLTLQTREQHIRRERATSNICTNQAINALSAAVYLATLGPAGLQHVARLCFDKAHYAAKRVAAVDGFAVPYGDRFVKEFVARCDRPVREINQRLLDRGMIGGFDLGRFYPELAGHMLLCVTEKRTRTEIDRLVECIGE